MLKKICFSTDLKKMHYRTGLNGPGRAKKNWPAGRTGWDFHSGRYGPSRMNMLFWWTDQNTKLMFYPFIWSIVISNYNFTLFFTMIIIYIFLYFRLSYFFNFLPIIIIYVILYFALLSLKVQNRLFFQQNTKPFIQDDGRRISVCLSQDGVGSVICVACRMWCPLQYFFARHQNYNGKGK
jgi:hypothetical protein